MSILAVHGINTHKKLMFYVGHLDKMSAAHSSQLSQVSERLAAVEQRLGQGQIQTGKLTDKLETVLDLVKEAAEGNT